MQTDVTLPSMNNWSSEPLMLYNKLVIELMSSLVGRIVLVLYMWNSIPTRKSKPESGCLDNKVRRSSWRGGDERFKNIPHVVLKLLNHSDHLHLLADGLPILGCNSISDLFAVAYVTDPLPAQILEAIRTNGGLKDIIAVECKKEEGQI